MTLPYASERPVPADRWSSYALIAARSAGSASPTASSSSPRIRAFSFAEPADILTAIPGLWLVGIGLLILARATYEMLQEPRLR